MLRSGSSYTGYSLDQIVKTSCLPLAVGGQVSQTRLTVGIGNPSPIKLRLEILELAGDGGVLMLFPLIPSVSPSPWDCSYLYPFPRLI